MTPPLLDVRDLHVEIPMPYGRLCAVRGVSLSVDAAEAVGLVGESGSGKSLTLRALLGLLPRPARIVSGAILIDGEEVTGLAPRLLRRRLADTMSMVFQDSLTALNPVMRVGDQIAEAPSRKLGAARAEARAIAVDLMAEVGIPDPERRYRLYPHELSGGLRQRICIAIALSTKPRLILADEPTTALDVTIQAQVLGLLGRLRRAERAGLLLVSHDLAVVGQTCSRLYVMYAGKIVESGALRSLITAPRHPYTFSLLRSVPDPDRRVARLLSIPGRPPDLAEPISGCSFAARCPFTEDACREREPALAPVPGGPARHSACRRADTAKRWPAMVAAEVSR
jgi:oligopeptide/dipeptide ABC transporter ATP-binding protein